MAWAKNGSTTLSSASDTITVSSLTDSNTGVILYHEIPSGSVYRDSRFNGDSGSNYAYRVCDNGGNEALGTSQPIMPTGVAGSSANSSFGIVYYVNVSTEEKLMMAWAVGQSTAGAGTAPNRREAVNKWVNTSDSVSSFTLTNSNTGDYDTNSNISVLGSELTPASAIAPETNSIFIETDTALRYWFNGTNWISPIPTRGLIGGGQSSGDVIDYITIATTGNATDFGDLTVSRYVHGAVNDATRGVWGGGYNSSLATRQNVMDYITIATTGNATDFGDLTVARQGLGQGVNSDTRGVFGGGNISGGYTNTMDYITIATTGNATDFGNMIRGKQGYSGCGSKTRGLFGGGITTGDSYLREIDYITIATTGNASDFGDLSTTIRYYPAGADDTSTRAVWAGGESPANNNTNVIDYVTIDTLGNATDFGDLTQARTSMGAVNSDTRACFGSGSNYNIIDYITVATTGNATDFGDMTVSRNHARGVEGS